MSIFTDHVVTVATNATPLLDKKPEPIKEAILRSILMNESIPDNIRNTTLFGIGNKMEQLFSYAQSTYSLGLPTSKSEVWVPNREAIKTYLEGIETDPVTVTSAQLSDTEYEFFLNDYLVNTHGYNRVTGRVTTLPAGHTTTMDTNLASFISASRATYDSNMTALRSSVPLTRTTEEPAVYNGDDVTLVTEYTITDNEKIAEVPMEERYSTYQGKTLTALDKGDVRYDLDFLAHQKLKLHLTGVITYSERRKIYYRYPDNSETIPTIEVDPLVKLIASSAEYTESHAISFEDTYTPVFNYMFRYYYVEYHTRTPSGEVVPKHLLFPEDAPGMPGFPRVSTDEPGLYFPVVPLRKDNTDLFDVSFTNTPLYETSIDLLRIIGIDALLLADSINENPQIASIDEAYVAFAVPLVTENEGAIRYLCKFFNSMGETQSRNLDFIDNAIPVDDVSVKGTLRPRERTPAHGIRIHEGGLDMVINWTKIKIDFIQGKLGKVNHVEQELEVTVDDVQILRLREQLDGDTYKEITVYGLIHTSYVYSAHPVYTRMSDLIDDPDVSTFLVPIRKDLVDELNPTEKAQLFYAAPQIISHSYDRTKLAWYASSAFQATVFIVSVAIMVTTGIDTFSAISTTFVNQGFTAGIIAILDAILAAVILDYVFELAVEFLGTKLAFVAAIVTLIASIYGMNTGQQSAIWADRLLEVSANISKKIVSNLENAIIDLENEYSLFKEKAEDLMDELEQKQELLKNSDLLNPLYFVSTAPILNFNESPDDFINRTTPDPDIAALTIAFVDDYVDVMLTPPKPSFSTQGII